jgi:CBS domain containing-hemolysin-like protein
MIQKKGELKLNDIKRQIIKTDHNSKVPILFDKLLRDREHLSLVIDKQKKIKGIVTLEDIIETALGFEIVDETDTVVDLQVLAKQKKK